MEVEIKLSYITRDNVNPRGKARVYFSYHPEDFGYLDHIANLLLSKQDCAIYYYDYAEQGEPDVNELAFLLREMQLIVVPVTSNYLFKDCTAYDFEFPFAQENNIPILPLLQDIELGAEFNRKCSNLQYFDEYSKDKSALSFNDKLERFLQSVLVSDETVKRIQAAFDAYVFLSYRKKDREYAQKLISIIHANPLCRDIAIWYDEFLIPGEPFDKAIEAMLKKSDLFALLVTPNLVNEDNYVQNVEFPAAKEAGKAMIAAEAKHTSKGKLKKLFKDIPKCVKIDDGKALDKELVSKLKCLAIKENNTPEHNFLIGLAFLSGIDVEYNPKHAIELITDAATSGLTEAVKKLVDIYYRGIGADRDIHKAIHWQQIYIGLIQSQIMDNHIPNEVYDLLSSRSDLADYLMEADNPIEAEAVHQESIALAERLTKLDFNSFAQYLATELGNISVLYFETGKLAECEEYIRKSTQVNDERIQRDPDADKGSIALNYNNIGMLYLENGSLTQACEFLNKSIDLLIDLLNEEPDKYSYYYAITCDNLGITYHHLNNAEKAEEFFEYAIKVREHLAKVNPDSFEEDLALSYNNAFAFYGDQNNYKKALDCLDKAIELFKELLQINPERYRKYLAQCYQNAGLFYKQHGEYDRAEEYLLLSNDYFEKLSEVFPERFLGDLADNLNILGVLYLDTNKLVKAESYQKEALDIWKKLYSIDSDRYAVDLATCYNNIGRLQMQSNPDRALEYLIKAVKVLEKIKENTRDTYYECYSSVCNNLGMLYKDIGKTEDALLWLGKSLDLRVKMSDMNHSRYDAELAFANNNLGVLYLEQDDLEKSISYFESAIKIYERIMIVDAERYRDEIAICYANAYTCKNAMDDKKSALGWLLKAISEYETLAKRAPDIYAEDLSNCYNNAGIMYEESEDYKNAERYYILSVELLEADQSKNSDVAYSLSVSLGNLGMLYDSVGDLQRAIDCYQKAVQTIKNNSSDDENLELNNLQLVRLYERLIDDCKKAGKTILASKYTDELKKITSTQQ